MFFLPDLPGQLYPTVGLQTPGEVIDANFGQEPFMFDIEGEMKELRRKTQAVISNFAWPKQVSQSIIIMMTMMMMIILINSWATGRRSSTRWSPHTSSTTDTHRYADVLCLDKISKIIC